MTSGSLMCIRPWNWSPLSAQREWKKFLSLREPGEEYTEITKRLSELETALQEQQTAFNELVDKLSHEDSRQDYRQRATGGNAPADTLTNC